MVTRISAWDQVEGDGVWENQGSQAMNNARIVMPNHLHGILVIVENDTNDPVEAGQGNSILSGVGAGQENPSRSGESSFAPPLQVSLQLIPSSLGAIIGVYKSTTARLINGLRRTLGASVWQRNYYERIIRDEREWDAIRLYIHNNPFKWELDTENPSLYHKPADN